MNAVQTKNERAAETPMHTFVHMVRVGLCPLINDPRARLTRRPPTLLFLAGIWYVLLVRRGGRNFR
jgi:hypothetical protein